LIEEPVKTLTVNVITVVSLVLCCTVQRRRADRWKLIEVSKEKDTHPAKGFVVGHDLLETTVDVR
jgi:hypothetical protein